eukprot:TRINITY_DN17231_c0_g1_i1.p1 TRINITY_DN17231_c0_g1~~TRINITY_DN17231_c0_g1_i1.p1  ORF type:complete len:383 (+),score=83.87 TRINITY_DN17231_c0_g1_i1:70-1149(+)
MGNWDTERAIKLDCKFPIWNSSIELASTYEKIEYKYLLKNGDSVIWENRENRVIKIKQEENIFITDKWNGHLLCEKNRSEGNFREKAKLKVMSFNIRFDNKQDGINAWDNRKELALKIANEEHDLVGLQEALNNQISYFSNSLPSHQQIGVGRSDGVDGGEFSPIYLKKSCFDVLEQETFWLSSTPEKIGSIGWGCRLPRICSYAILLHKSGKLLGYFNTHLDHESIEARGRGLVLITKKMKEIGEKYHPQTINFILTGDFNEDVGDYSSKDVFGILNSDYGKSKYGVCEFKLVDSKKVSEKFEGENETFTGWSKSGINRIDYIFVDEGVKVTNHKTLPNHIDGKLASDHRPIISEIEI